jgi:trehalose 6-phosphate phosphatase
VTGASATDPLASALRRIAEVPTLLVASDFDGTLAPIADTPDGVDPDDEALASLVRLAQLPRTHAAVLSGRGRATLRALVGTRPELHLIGSHGAELGGALSLPAEADRLRAELIESLRPLAGRYEGAMVEPKPTGVAFHYRRVDPGRRAGAVSDVLEGPARRAGVWDRVVELLVVEADKGEALDRLRAELQPDATLFLGDDRTDEDAFARLRGADVGVKVGSGDTAAALRIEAQKDVAPLLGALAALRERHAAATPGTS